MLRGIYWYCGRSDDIVEGVWPMGISAEIEGLLFQHPAVLEAAVVGWEDEIRSSKPKSFVGTEARPELIAAASRRITSVCQRAHSTAY